MRYLLRLTLLAAVAIVGFAGQCVRFAEDCPRETHAEKEPAICKDFSYPPSHHLLCVSEDDNRSGPLERWYRQGSGRRMPLYESNCLASKVKCRADIDCCSHLCDYYRGCF